MCVRACVCVCVYLTHTVIISWDKYWWLSSTRFRVTSDQSVTDQLRQPIHRLIYIYIYIYIDEANVWITNWPQYGVCVCVRVCVCVCVLGRALDERFTSHACRQDVLYVFSRLITLWLFTVCLATESRQPQNCVPGDLARESKPSPLTGD